MRRFRVSITKIFDVNTVEVYIYEEVKPFEQVEVSKFKASQEDSAANGTSEVPFDQEVPCQVPASTSARRRSNAKTSNGQRR
jgi:hypothetical protein